MNFFSQGWGEDYRDLLESVPYRRRAEEIISDCMGTELHMYCTQQITNDISRLIQRNKQCTKLHEIN